MQLNGTTIVSVRRDHRVVIGGDGQVTMGDTIMKHHARKVRRLYHDSVIAGFAGATADAFTLFERFEGKLNKHQGNLVRSAVAMAKEWRADSMLKQLEAVLVVADTQHSLMLTGCGDVIEPEDSVMAVGSGGHYARAVAKALFHETPLDAVSIVKKSLSIAAELCIYTNHQQTIEILEGK